ncbi:transporter, partial [Candidatus Omnitrophota bacterium]
MRRILDLVLFLLIVLVIIIPSVTYAARPISTDDAGTVEKRRIEIESGFEYVKQADEENNLSFVLKYGIIKNLDLGIEIPYTFIDFNESANVDGMGDIQCTTKYHFLDETQNLPALALSCSIKTKTGDKGLSSGEVDYALTGIMTKEIREFTTHVNFGYTIVGEPEGEKLDDIFSYGLAIEYPVNEKLNIAGELTGETIFDGDFDDNPCSALTGLNYAFSEIVTFDFGVGFEISEA